jgi:hypothetical protein
LPGVCDPFFELFIGEMSCFEGVFDRKMADLGCFGGKIDGIGAVLAFFF